MIWGLGEKRQYIKSGKPKKESGKGNGNIQALVRCDAQLENIHYGETALSICNLHSHLRVQNGNADQIFRGTISCHPFLLLSNRAAED